MLPEQPTGYANSTSGDRGYLIMDTVPVLDVLDYREIPRERLTRITDHNVIYADVAAPVS